MSTTSSTFNPGKGTGEPVGIAILGHGTVGSEVLRLLNKYEDDLVHRIGGAFELKGVAVGDLAKVRPGVPKELFTDDAMELINRDDVDIVVEVIGGIDYPREVVLAALRAGKSVVTANKALVAAHSAELAEAADEAGVDLYFEAAVAAAIPVLGNGTTNFILDAMDSTGASYDDMFAEAQRLGYVEADPSADIDGHDAASKAAILASLAFHTRVTSDDVYCEGISNISATDIKAAQSAGYTIKLLAICERLIDDNGQETVSARVHPTLVPRSHPLASVDKSFNAIFIEAEAAGRLMFYGNGAGGAPTASAVLGDLVGAARNKVHGGRAPGESTYASLPIADFGDVETRYHIDMEVDDRIGVLAETAAVFSDRGISLRTVRQEEGGEDHARLVIVTHKAKESDLAATIESLNNLPAVKAVNSVIRLEGE